MLSWTRNLLHLHLNAYPSSNATICSALRYLCTSQIQTSTPGHKLVAEYLVNSLNLSWNDAVKCARHLPKEKYMENLESFLAFFRTNGFNDTQIKKLVSWSPPLLQRDVKNSLEPKFKAIQDIGFYGLDLALLIQNNPIILNLSISSVQQIIKYWKGVAGSGKLSLSFFVKNQRLFTSSFESKIFPNVSIIRSWGVSNDTIFRIVKLTPSFIMQRPDKLKKLEKQVELLGVPRHSGMFVWVVLTLSLFNEVTFKSKIEQLRKLGWSQEEVVFAICKNPSFLHISSKLLNVKVDYFLKKVGMDPSYLIRNPVILTYSLEKRFIPRNCVIETLKSRGLHAGTSTVTSFMCLSEKNFLKRYILPYKEAPELSELYGSLLHKGSKERKCLYN